MNDRMSATENLQQKLMADLRPVKVLASNSKRTLAALCLAILPQAVFVARAGLREDLADQLFRLSFVLPAAGLFCAAVGSLILTIRSSVPGIDRYRLLRGFIVSCLVIVLAVTVMTGMGIIGHTEEGWALDDSYKCATSVLAFAFIPIVVLLLEARRGYSLHKRTSGLAAFVAGATLGALSVGLTCPSDEVLHLLVWHLAPVLLLCLVGYFGAHRLLYRNKRF